MNWLDIVSKIMEQDGDKIQLAPLSNISGADIKFDKGYGTLKINVPADVANDLTNGSCKYMGGLLLIDRPSYKDMERQIEEMPATDATEVVHGKWVNASKKAGVNAGMKCSICSARIKCSEFFNGNHRYCHKCGAIMDGK